MSVSNFSRFRHLQQNGIHDGRHGDHLESLRLLSAREQLNSAGKTRKLDGAEAWWKTSGSMEI